MLMNNYSAKLIRICNSGTIKVWIDLGFGVVLPNIKVHLKGVVSPTGVNGDRATEKLAELMPQQFLMEHHPAASEREGKFIITIKLKGEFSTVNQQLIDSGLVEKYQD
jgi:hypothetical protein|tara:strand:- start:8376 stop:8699 length:324 start_codon:yes stop_codon:yes gene_type:complete